MREHGVPQFTVDAHRPVKRLRRLRRQLLHRARLHEHAHRARPRRASRWRPRTAPRTHPIVLAGGHAAFNPEPIADFIDAAVVGDGEQAVLAITDDRPRMEGRGPPRRPRGAAVPPGARPAASTSRGSTTSSTCRTAASTGSRRTGPACRAGSSKHTVMDLDEWPYPKQPLVPLAETVHERMSRGDLPRLHPRLPLLPGRHDHPPGARALASPASARWSRRACKATGYRGGRPALALQRRPHRDRRRSPRASPTATRAPTPRCPCPPPASTPSTSTWPTS